MKWFSTFLGGVYGGAVDMAIDGKANIYLCGFGFHSQGSYGVELPKLDSSGSITWTNIFESTTLKSYVPVAMAIDNSNLIYISLRSVTATNKSMMTTVKYTQSINSISNFEFPDRQITNFSLQNYPNPFNPKTTISF